MTVRELIKALSVLDPNLPVKIRERGDLPEDIYPPFERRFGDVFRDHVLLEVLR